MKRGEDAVTSGGVVTHDHVPRLLTTERVATSLHRLEHVAVTDLGLANPDILTPQGVNETEVAHHSRDHGVGSERPGVAHGQRQDRQDLVTVNDIALMVHCQAPVGVPIQGEADVRVVLDDRLLKHVEVRGAAAVVDVQPVRPGADRDHFGTRGCKCRGPGDRRRPVRTVEDDLEPVETSRQRRNEVSCVVGDCGVEPAHPTHTSPDRAIPGLTQPAFYRDLDRVVELVAPAGEELDPVVGHRVVTGRKHHAQVGFEGASQVGHTRGGQNAEKENVDASRGEPGHDRGLEELPRDPGVTSDNGNRPQAMVDGCVEDASLTEHVCCGHRKVEGELGEAGVFNASIDHGLRPVAVVGRDTRISGEFLEAAVVAGLASAGVDVLLLGVLPTPGVAYLTGALKADLGVMLSASHNPMPDNGIKFLARGGNKLDDAIEIAIESRLREPWDRPIGARVGRVRRFDAAVTDYAAHLVATLPRGLDRLKVVLDCAHGAASVAGPAALAAAGAEVVAICAGPDGLNINDGCGSTHLDVLQKAVVEHNADVGFALDGDADRCLAVDHEGNIVDGDQILAILALAMRDAGTLRANTVVATVMSNLGFVHALRRENVGVRQTKVGDRYVLEAMKAGGYSLGGEQSGHVIMSDHATTGDGILTALHVLSRMAELEASLAELV